MLSSAINNKESVDTGTKHGNYSVKVHSEKYSTWYMKYGKYNISLLMPKQTDLRDGARPDSHVTALWRVHIAKNDIHFPPYRFANINFCHYIHVASIQDLLEKSYAKLLHGKFWFGFVKETDLLSIARSFVGMTGRKPLLRKHFLKTIYCLSNCY